MLRKLIATATLSAMGVTGLGVATATSASATLPGSGNYGYDMLLTPPVLNTDNSVSYYVGQTGFVTYYKPSCTNWAYDMLATGGVCYYGYADVYQTNSSYPVYKDVKLWINGVRVQADRFVTQCTPGQNLCGTSNVRTVWMLPGIAQFAGGSFEFTYTAGASYCIQTTVWFWENGRWLANTLTTHFQF
jgi:hypothetical protein